VTNTDAIRELSITVPILQERLDNTRQEIQKFVIEVSRASDSLVDMSRKVAVLEAKVEDLKRLAEERDRRRWGVYLAVIGCVLASVANIALTYFKLK
jgi:hypothetical protein